MTARNAKRDDAPRGVFRRGRVWAIRFTCGAGHVHEETIGTVKGEAVRAHHERRGRVLAEPGWCPRVARQAGREQARAEEARARSRVTFRAYAEQNYLPWAAVNKRSGAKERYSVAVLVAQLGDRPLDTITTADVERLRDGLLEGRTGATVNRYRDLLSAMFKRAVRLGLVTTNPVKGVPKYRETGQRIVWLGHEEEAAILGALPERLRPAFIVSVHTGLRFGEQARLTWRDVDVLGGVITVPTSKTGAGRGVPMNAAVRAAVVDVAARRGRPDDPDERLFPLSHRQTAILFNRAVGRAQEALRDSGRATSRLDGYTWHGNRHTFASRLVMAGVDVRTVQQLGGWKTLAMVLRYAHLSPDHLRSAVERLVPAGTGGAGARMEVGLELDFARSVSPAGVAGVG